MADLDKAIDVQSVDLSVPWIGRFGSAADHACNKVRRKHDPIDRPAAGIRNLVPLLEALSKQLALMPSGVVRSLAG
jgi:hypothetical protein